ncbi:MAG: sigma-70 family RNA polymerase sigma factor [Prolixibacteraceae bacterium]|nr:sigma-70 family RNA polymerase sigma factor [Prolixibacteraceae bacterium]
MKPVNWDDLYKNNAAGLKGVCRRYVGSKEIAEDLVQETFITAMEKIQSFKGWGSIEGWMKKIAINKSLIYLRERQKSDIPSDDLVNKSDNNTEMEQSTNSVRAIIEQASFSKEELLSVIDELPEHHKTVFNLYVIDGYSHNKIAEMLNISTGTSKSHLSRARKKAQESLYLKASGYQQEKKQKNKTFFILFLTPNYIDKIFRKGFSNYEIAACGNVPFQSSSAQIFIKTGASLAGKIILAGFTISASVGGIYLYNSLTKNNETILPENKNTIIIPDTCNSQRPSLQPDSVKATIPAKENLERPDMKKNDQVIIRKTIVVHDTVRLEKPISE